MFDDVEYLKLYVDLGKSLVWPLLILVLVIWFHKSISDTFALLPRLRKVKVAGQEIEIGRLEDEITNAIEKAMIELKRAFPAHKSGRLMSLYRSEETTYYVHMIETIEKIGVDINEPAIFNAVGHHYFATDKQKSKIYYEKALRLSQDDIDTHTNMGFWYLKHGNDLSSAKQECDIARQILENDRGNRPWTYVCLSSIYERLGLKNDQNASVQIAKEMFSSHIAEDKTNFWAHYGLGWCWSKGENIDLVKAIECARESLKIKPDFQPARYNLACHLAQTGYAHEAVAELRCIAKQSNQNLIFYGIEKDADFENISTDQEFIKFMEAMDLEYNCKERTEADLSKSASPSIAASTIDAK